ncbi:UBA/THIF-type NAD/FAD binding protein [Chloroherpeton thalassium ATCC 35110]|uniref:Molybdopterin-synthase adenylyltransferase n=1 Tax=Chloroherpeton thalassium (strain ATCC 35110 / GB-78) TaxID=517418 RepID=B3QW72_CHLT3|nr:molybdopterin-synthase adenylyltransferase MoeB [Chloroherpeton thalassium]ACF13185.1 UBA/THIF-type NAD/FAD binding protein [Chloroherpeton thalassium ATCC 35110]
MGTKILIPTALRQYAGGHDVVEVSAGDVAKALAELTSLYPALKKNLFAENGKLRSFINVYKGEENIKNLNQLETTIEEGDELLIVPSIAGGAPADLEVLHELSNEEIQRYSRHLLVPEFGMEGQKKLKQASVLMIGAGGLGSPLGMYLAAAGVGKLGIVEYDTVDYSNLQRQLLYKTADVGRSKAEAARDTIKSINPFVEVEIHQVPLTSLNALDILKHYDVVADGTDNFPTRYLVNDACVMLGKPNVYGSIFRFEGQVSVFHLNDDTACYRCLYPEPPPPGLVPSCAQSGVLGVLPGIIGSLQAIEVIKIITGIGEPLANRLITFDALKMKFRELKLKKDPECLLCSEHPAITELIDYEQFCGMPAHDRIEKKPLAKVSTDPNEITVHELKSRFDRGEKPFILDVRNPTETQICCLEETTLIPLNELPARLHELDAQLEIIALCRSGARSDNAAEFLRKNGFKNVKNLVGGILAWSKEIDPTMPTY